MLYAPRSRSTFAQVTALLAELGMTIVDVRIVPLANGFSLDTYIFMELDTRTEVDDARLARICNALAEIVAENGATTPSSKRCFGNCPCGTNAIPGSWNSPGA